MDKIKKSGQDGASCPFERADIDGYRRALHLSQCPLTRSLSEASPLSFFMLDQEGRVQLWNDTSAKIFGWTAVEVLGRFLPIVPPEKKEDFWVHFNQLLNGGSFSGLERTGLRKDGSRVDMSIAASPLKDRDGRISTIMVFIQDITSQKHLEKEFHQAQKMEAVGRLAGGIAHDFNNLLTAISGYSDFLLRNIKKGDPNRGDVEEIKKAGERAAELTRQLLAFSRRQILQPKVLNLNAVATGIAKMFKRLIGEDIELITFLDPDLGCAKADPGQIEQVMMNLVVNSRDAMPSGGKITIVTSNVDISDDEARTHPGLAPGPHVMLSISDTGIGMGQETQARLFEPFFTTKEAGKGTGLGLATVYGIVKQIRGSIEVISELGRGTTMNIFLPRVAEAPSTAPPSFPTTAHGSETVLLVDDDDRVRQMIARGLSLLGYIVLDTADPEEAARLYALHQNKIDILVTDMVMPRMHGRDLAKRLLSLKPGMKVIYISGYTDAAMVQNDLLEKSAEFLQKPLTATSLALKMRQLLDPR